MPVHRILVIIFCITNCYWIAPSAWWLPITDSGEITYYGDPRVTSAESAIIQDTIAILSPERELARIESEFRQAKEEYAVAQGLAPHDIDCSRELSDDPYNYRVGKAPNESHLEQYPAMHSKQIKVVCEEIVEQFGKLNSTNQCERVKGVLELFLNNHSLPKNLQQSLAATLVSFQQCFDPTTGCLSKWDYDFFLSEKLQSFIQVCMPGKLEAVCTYLGDYSGKKILEDRKRSVWQRVADGLGTCIEKVVTLPEQLSKPGNYIDKIRSSKENRDLLRFIKLCEQNRFDEARTIQEKYEQASAQIAALMVTVYKEYQSRFQIYNAHGAIAREWRTILEKSPSPTIKNRLERRLVACDQIMRELEEGSIVCSRTVHTLTPKIIACLDCAQVAIETITSCYGNALQRRLHEEYVVIVENASDWVDRFTGIASMTSLALATVQLAGIGCEFNKAALVHQAANILEVCHVALDFECAVLEGLALGACNTGKCAVTLCAHPIDTIGGIVSVAKNVVVLLAEDFWQASYYNGLLEFYGEDAAEQWAKDHESNVGRAARFLCDTVNKMSPREVVKHGVALGTEYMLTRKLHHAVGSCCKAVVSQTIEIAEVGLLQKVAQRLRQTMQALEEGQPDFMNCWPDTADFAVVGGGCIPGAVAVEVKGAQATVGAATVAHRVPVAPVYLLHEKSNNNGQRGDNNSAEQAVKRIFEGASYHHQNSKGRKSPPPKDGQKALDNSICYKIKENGLEQRISVFDGEISILNEHASGRFHGHVMTWIELNDDAQALLRKKQLVNAKGKILKG